MRPGWWDEPVSDEFLLRTVEGAVDYLAHSLQVLAEREHVEIQIVKRLPAGVRIRYRGPLSTLAGNRFFARCAVVLAELADPSVGATEADLAAAEPALGDGVVAAMARSGPLGFRVGEVGERRFQLRDLLQQRDGWHNDPGDWQLNLEQADGLLVGEVGELHTTRRFGRLERVPASTTPVISAVLVRLLKAEAGHVVCDPFCGAGTNLLHAHAMTAAGPVIGTDHDRAALAAAATNLAAVGAPRMLARADATRLPLPDGSVDRIVANLPFGKRVGSHQDNETLYPAFLREVVRVLAPRARAVLLTEDKRLLRVWARRVPGLRPVKEVLLASGGAHPSAFVLTNRRPRR